VSDDRNKNLAAVFDFLIQWGGTLVVSAPVAGPPGSDREDVLVSVEFGREADDSDMVGGAAYGVGPTLEEALESVVADLGLS
jgi:hypothetical protein